VGPFYCSRDHTVYLNVAFFRQLELQFSVSGHLAEAFVVAHEFGHHVQNLLSITSRLDAADTADPARKNARSVLFELQADCLAGVWAHSAYARSQLAPLDVKQALAAAEVLGDDYLARASGSTVDPDSWTHGSSAQREHWVETGYKDGRASTCDTFGRP
jgi:predicted metalloprotease